MRIAISNIAWDPAEDDAVGALLRSHGVDAVDVAPGKYFADPKTATEADAIAVREAWKKRGMSITGMQALLFGTTGLNLFGTKDSRAAMLDHLRAVCRIGGWLGAKALVFGSPKNRDRGTLSDDDVREIAVEFFRELGVIAAAAGVVICLEPNPPRYGANFMIDANETATIVRAVGHAAIGMQFDTGAVALSNDDPARIVATHGALLHHVHVSEPDLAPAGDGGVDHAAMSAAVRKLPLVACIEMVATKSEPHLTSIARALTVTLRHYRDAA